MLMGYTTKQGFKVTHEPMCESNFYEVTIKIFCVNGDIITSTQKYDDDEFADSIVEPLYILMNQYNQPNGLEGYYKGVEEKQIMEMFNKINLPSRQLEIGRTLESVAIKYFDSGEAFDVIITNLNIY